MTPVNFSSEFKPYDIPLHGVRLPEFAIDPKEKEKLGVAPQADNFTFLEALCLAGAQKLGLLGQKEYEDRFKYELGILNELGFSDYILLVWDIINYCKSNDIPTGPGRGSVCGGLVPYLIGITKIDPIKYELYFERFISKTRAKKQVIDGITYLDGSLMCDIDVDICYYNRGKVLQYLEERFKGKTCKISTLNTLQGKLLIKECGKIVESLSEDEVKEVANMIPEMFGKVRDIKIACEGEKNKDDEWKYEPVKEFSDWCSKHPNVYQTALKLRNLIKNKSVHASAMLVSYDPLDESCPVEVSSSKEVVSAYDMASATIANLKLDLLGLRAVSVVDDVCKTLNISIDSVDFNDPFIYQHLQELKSPHGLFQIEADAVFRAIKKIKPKSLDELSGVMAIVRPGASQFIDRYSLFTNTGTADSIHPFFDDILGKTGGLCLYQEQLMKMVSKIGFSLEEAEIVRRVVGKKDTKKMAEWEEKVKRKVKENNLDPSVSDILWRVMDDSKNYSFNKSHSVAYASLSASTIYLKFKYPQQFFLSLLKMTKHEPDPIDQIAKIEKELHHFGIKLLPPHIIKSDLDFSLEGENIRFGLLSIKGISDKSIEKLTKFRHKYSNKFEVFQAAEEAKLGIGILSALIQAGAIGEMADKRSRAVLEAQLWNLLKPKEKQLCLRFAEQFKFDLFSILHHIKAQFDERGRPLIRPSRIDTIKKHYEPYKQIYEQNRLDPDFVNWFYERKLLGYTYNVSLKDIFRKKNPNIISITDLEGVDTDDEVLLIGVVKEAHSGVSKKKTKYYKMSVGDEGGDITVMLFETPRSKSVSECQSLNGEMPQKENIVIIKGIKKDDCIFANKVAVQDQKVFTKLSELKASKQEEVVDTE